MTRFLIHVFSLSLCIALHAQESKDKENFGYRRVFAKAKADPAWSEKKDLRERLMLIRSKALRNSAVSNPVSDRYCITCYGGPIDLVHFLMLAAEVVGGKNHEERLYKEWLAEGGETIKEHPRGHFEAHPDDLPSNALGALFGAEILPHKNDPNLDIEAAFAKFIAPLIPVPDAITQRLSHQYIVMGLPGKRPARKLQLSRKRWFTAAPLNLTRLINAYAKRYLGKSLCNEMKYGKEALEQAGFVLRSYRNAPILILRKQE